MAAVALFMVLALMFGVCYYLNAKTPKPEGCEDMKESCAGCQNLSCAHRPRGGESL